LLSPMRARGLSRRRRLARGVNICELKHSQQSRRGVTRRRRDIDMSLRLANRSSAAFFGFIHNNT
jgi:hypothetical protein